MFENIRKRKVPRWAQDRTNLADRAGWAKGNSGDLALVEPVIKILEKQPSLILPDHRKGVGKKAKWFILKGLPLSAPKTAASPDVCAVIHKSPADTPMRRVESTFEKI